MATIIEDVRQDAWETAGTTTPRVLDSPASRAAPGCASLLEGEKEGPAQRGWWRAGQSEDDIPWDQHRADEHRRLEVASPL